MFSNAPYSEHTYAQGEHFNLVNSAKSNLISAFNFCSADDHILPAATGDVSTLDWQHLWGLYTGIEIGGSTPEPPAPDLEPRPPEPSHGAAEWASRESIKNKKKRKAILDDDEELMRIIAMALPEIIQKYRNRNG